MSTGILLITHDGIGAGLLDTARYMLGELPAPAEALAVDSDADTEELDREAVELAARLDDGDGVLVLTDLVGSTPANVADRLAGRSRALVVTGVNLPMLVKVLNYAALPLDELAAKAVEGGRSGILCTAGTG